MVICTNYNGLPCLRQRRPCIDSGVFGYATKMRLTCRSNCTMMYAVEKGVVQSHTVNITVRSAGLAVCTPWVTRLFDNCRGISGGWRRVFFLLPFAGM